MFPEDHNGVLIYCGEILFAHGKSCARLQGNTSTAHSTFVVPGGRIQMSLVIWTFPQLLLNTTDLHRFFLLERKKQRDHET